jgi:putative ABC transport system permease protein
MISRVPSSLGDRFYRGLLQLYPAPFRHRFGAEMIELFRVRCAAARSRGVLATIAFCSTAAIDFVISVCREHGLGAPSLRRLVTGSAISLRDAARFLHRSPGLSVTIVLLMALTIGAASSVFSVVNAVLIKPLPYGDPEKLVIIWETRSERNTERNAVSGHEFPAWEEQSRAFVRMAALAWWTPVTLTGAGDPKSLIGVRVTAGFFDVMGVAPRLGRTFVPAEDVPGQGQVVVLSERLWRERFSGDSGVMGRKVLLDDRPFEVVGVMPETFSFPPSALGARVDFWTPIAEPIRLYRGRHYLSVVARMKPEVSLETAQSDMDRVAHNLRTEFPELNYGHAARVVPLQRELARSSRGSLMFLFGAVLCLLLIGCSNIAGLLLARGLTRQQEIGVRLALGSTRLGVARQLLAESLLLAFGGAVIGIAGANWITEAIPRLVPRSILSLDRIPVDTTVLGFALLMSIATGLLFGIAPALQIRRVNLAATMQQSARTLVGAGQPRLRQALVAGQVALTVVLAIGAGLMTRGLLALQAVDLGYSTSGMLAVDLALPGARYRTAIQQRQFFSELTARTSAAPGVVSAALTHAIPLDGKMSGIGLTVEGQPTPPPGQERAARYRIVSADFFKTMGIPFIDGRPFAASDARLAVPLLRWYPQQPLPDGYDKPQPPPVAVINQTMATQLWPGANPVGRRFKMLFSPWITVIGIVADSHNDSPGDAAKPEIYLHDLQEPQAAMSVLVRTAGDPLAFAPILRSTIRDLDRHLAINSTRTMDDIVDETFGLSRLTSSLVGTFALLALGLMLAGIYGLMAFTAAQRLPELGLRMALGAERRQVRGLIIRQGLMPALIGVLIGLAGAAALVRSVQADIFGMPTLDPLTWLAVPTVLLAAILVACWWPARRAAQVEPVIVLRAH